MKIRNDREAEGTGTPANPFDLDSFLDRLESRVRLYSRDFPTVFDYASGPYLYDSSGRPYVDFLSGAGALNYGHNHPVLVRALIAYLQRQGIVQGLDLATAAKIDFMRAFETHILTPRSLSYKLQFTSPSGADAIEAALRLARLVTDRANIVAFTGSYHGQTLGASSVTAAISHRRRSYRVGNVTFLPYDGFLTPTRLLLEDLDAFIADPGSGLDPPAAFIVECIQAEGGVNIASADWLRGLERLARSVGALLIVDDIQVGVGRTGQFFSFEDIGISPDIIALSKSISGIGLPMSLLLIKPTIDYWEPGEQTGTFRGNNLAFVTATESIHEFWSNDELQTTVVAQGEVISNALDAFCVRYPQAAITHRGQGMIQALDLRSQPLTRRVIADCFAQGLVLESCGPGRSTLKLLPPLTIETNVLQQGLEILGSVLGQVDTHRSTGP